MSDGMQTQQMPAANSSGTAPPAGTGAPGGSPSGGGGVPPWVLVVVVLAVALLAGAGVWIWQSSSVKNAQDRIAAAEAAQAAQEAKAKQLEEELAQSKAHETSAGSTAGSSTNTASGAIGSGTVKPKPVTVKQFTFIKKMTRVDGVYRLTADFAQFLTGDAANAAAAAHGDESPTPNDYYIVNDNPKLRTYRVKSGIKPRIIGYGAGTDWVTPEPVSLSVFFNLMPGGAHPRNEWSHPPYWIWITDGVITKIEQQYIP